MHLSQEIARFSATRRLVTSLADSSPTGCRATLGTVLILPWILASMDIGLLCWHSTLPAHVGAGYVDDRPSPIGTHDNLSGKPMSRKK